MNNLKPLLEKQQQLLETLVTQLESELHLISSRDAEALTQVIQDKAATLDQVAETDKQIEAAYKQSPDAMTDPQVSELFDNINLTVEQCKFRTEINQKAVEQGQLRLDHLRSLLLESRAKESMTYDKSGKTKGGPSGKGVSA